MLAPEFARYAALTIFCVGFASFLFLDRYRYIAALFAAVLVVALGLFSPAEALRSVDWKIVTIFFTTLAAAEVFMLSGAAAMAAEAILTRLKRPVYAILTLCALTGFLSMFVENVACVLIAAPVALSLASRLKMPPQPILVACALASNLQGCGLLVGDPPSMLLAEEARFSFLDFIWVDGRPSIFWAVQAGGLAGLVFLWFVFRKHTGTVEIKRTARLLGILPTVCLFGVVASLAVGTQLENGIGWGAAIGCSVFAVISFLWLAARTRGGAAPDEKIEDALFAHELPNPVAYLKGLDWNTILFITAVFIPVSALAHYGWINDLASVILSVSHGNPLLVFLILVITAMIASAFVDNVPFLLVMLPAVTALGTGCGIEGRPIVLYFGLLLGASVGGNITPIGAQANIAAVGLLRKHGAPITLRSYLSLSLPYTILAVAAAALWTYFFYGC